MSARISSASRTSAVEIRTPAALAQIAKRFAPVVLQNDDTPVPPANADYFSRMSLPTNIALDSGNYVNYHVQFDTRFVVNYILYHTSTKFPEMNIKGHPYVTPLSYAGFCLTLFYTHILACDATFLPVMSGHAKDLLGDPQMKDIYDLLLRCHVPTFLSDLLIELAPTYDPRRNNHLFCPSLAGYSHLHDFGRTFPPSLFYAAHHVLASTRTNAEPDDVLLNFMQVRLLEFDNRPFYPANYLGTFFDGNTHVNFINQDFFAFFNPLVSRALTMRPTFARLPFECESLSPNNVDSIYSALLLLCDDNIHTANTLYTAMDTFIMTDEPKSAQLGSVLASLSGSLLLSHSIEPPTLPTWIGEKTKPKKVTTDLTDKKFASDSKFMAQQPTGKHKLAYPTDDKEIVTELYLHKAADFDADNAPYEYLKFNGKFSASPDVLYFQPYDVSPSSLGLTIASGIKIEIGEIAGFMVPTERPESSLDDNNSQFLQSAIRLSQIHTIAASDSWKSSGLHLLARDELDNTNQGIMLAMISMAKSVLPSFASNLLPKKLDRPIVPLSSAPEDNHWNPESAFNVHAGTNANPGKTTPYYYLWSSYRYVKKMTRPSQDEIYMFGSFRPIYGTNVTLSRSKNPSLLIPH